MRRKTCLIAAAALLLCVLCSACAGAAEKELNFRDQQYSKEELEALNYAAVRKNILQGRKRVEELNENERYNLAALACLELGLEWSPDGRGEAASKAENKPEKAVEDEPSPQTALPPEPAHTEAPENSEASAEPSVSSNKLTVYREAEWEAGTGQTFPSERAAVADAEASSSLGKRYDAKKACDDKEKTSWQYDYASGKTESISFSFNGTQTISAISLQLGSWESPEKFAKNYVPKTLRLEFNGISEEVSFAREQTQYWILFAEPVETAEFKFSVLAVYSGTETDDVCIAEVGFYSDEITKGDETK